MEKQQQQYPKWLYSKTKGGMVLNNAFEEAQLDTADEWRDIPWPAPPKEAQSEPKPDGGLPTGPCQKCADREAGYDKAYAQLMSVMAELQQRYDTLMEEFKMVSAEAATAKDALAKIRTTKKAEAAAEKAQAVAVKEGE